MRPTLVLIALFACKSDTRDRANEATRPCTPTIVDDVIDLGAVIAPPPTADAVVHAPIAGRVAKVLVAEGQQVAAGTLLAIVEDPSLEVAVRQAEHNLATVPAHDRRAAEAARARVAEARAQHTRGDVKAPRAGVVVQVYRNVGESVDVAIPIVRVADISVLEAHAQGPADALQRLTPGMPARVRALGVEAAVAATIAEVATAVEPRTALGLVRLTLASDGVTVGTAARVEIVVGKRETTCR